VFGFVVGLILGAFVVAVVTVLHRWQQSRSASSAIETTRESVLDLRPAQSSSTNSDVLELWWEERPVVSIQRLAVSPIGSEPVSGAMGSLISQLLDDERIRGLVAGERYAMVKVPRHLGNTSWMRTVEGVSLPVLRDSTGRIRGLAPIVAGSTGATFVAAAPVIAGALAAAWAQHQLASTMTAVRAGMEQIELRLDDGDHGILEAAQTRLTRLSGPSSSWSVLDIHELAVHRASLEGVYAMARRRANRRFESLASGDEFPALSSKEVGDVRRELVLLVDATLVRGQMELAQKAAELEATGGTDGLAAIMEVEADLKLELDSLADRFGEILERTEPGWHRVTARLRAQDAKSELGRTLGAVEELLTDLNEDKDIELLLTERDGTLEIRALVASEPGAPSDAVEGGVS